MLRKFNDDLSDQETQEIKNKIKNKFFKITGNESLTILKNSMALLCNRYDSVMGVIKVRRLSYNALKVWMHV